MDDDLTPATALIERGEFKAAVKALERARSSAVKRDDLAELERILEQARLLRERTEGKTHEASGRLAYAAKQNIRFLSRKTALTAGEEWVDPFVADAARELRRGPDESKQPVPSRAVVWARRRRTAAMVGLCVVVPGLVIAATGNTNVAIAWTEIGLIASPVAFFVPSASWSASIWLCGVAALYVLGSAVLNLLAAFFVGWVGGTIALGLLMACLAGTLALVGCVGFRDSLLALVAFESSAAIGIGGALALIGSDSKGLHHVVGGAATDQFVSDLSYLYTLWATAGVMIVTGIAVAIFQSKRQHP